MDSILLLNVYITIFMFSVILMTQIVSYPLLRNVDNITFLQYHNFYVSRIFIIVAPAMIFEFILSFYILYFFKSSYVLINFLTIALIFLSTVLIQVPIHEKLKHSKDNFLINRLINTNWIRTILWGTKLVISNKILLKEILWIL